MNYNLDQGWFVTTSPVLTANWEADGVDDKFTVPVGGGAGRLVRLGSVPVSLQLEAFYNVVRPRDDTTADWQLRLQVQFLFPK